MTGNELFAPILVPDDLLASTSGQAWVRAMLDAEAALARAEAAAGIVPPGDAERITDACRTLTLDAGELGRAARAGGNPVIPLVLALRTAVEPGTRAHVHLSATSQDILDTAAMLVARRSIGVILPGLDTLAGQCAALAERHRTTLMAGRTLLQHAVPVTFGGKAAGWLMGVLDARDLLRRSRERLAVQFGGAAGTLASLGTAGPDVVARFAAELGLAEPTVPWHTARQRVAELAATLGIVAGTAAKIGGDVVLLAQTEVGEVTEALAPGRGSSSTMPHKHNPVDAIATVTAARRCAALVPVALEALVAEQERAAGGWQAEWATLADLLGLAGGAVAHAVAALDGLTVDPDAMARNLRKGGGAVLAERVLAALTPLLGREEAAERVARAASAGPQFAAALLEDPVLAEALATAGWDGPRLGELLDPATYVGATDTWIDRALAAYRKGG